MFKPKISGLCTEVKTEEDKKEEIAMEKWRPEQIKAPQYTYTSAAFFKGQTTMNSMKEKDPSLFANMTDKLSDERD